MKLAFRTNEFLRQRRRALTVAHRLTRPPRRAALPVLVGNGRGLRVRVGPSTLMRVISRVEVDTEAAFLDGLRPGDVAYDLGANIGWFSLLAARRVGPDGRVFAFEPSLANVSYIRANAATNRLSNVIAVPAAVSKRDGWGQFSQPNSLQGALSSDGEIWVPLVSLDRWLDETGNPPPNALKIDVEGAEGDVLRGMLGTLRTVKPTLIIELHGTNAEVADLLDSVNYQHSPVDSTAASTRDAPWWAHVLARPSG